MKGMENKMERGDREVRRKVADAYGREDEKRPHKPNTTSSMRIFYNALEANIHNHFGVHLPSKNMCGCGKHKNCMLLWSLSGVLCTEIDSFGVG